MVITPLDPNWKCVRCEGTGDYLVMDGPGPNCLACMGLGDLVLVLRGDAALTRRAKAASPRSAVVVRWSRARKHYERQGILVEEAALRQAQASLATGPKRRR